MVMKWRCNVDSDNVLQSYEEIDESIAAPGDVLFDTKPDLAEGRYRWNGERFDPVDLGQTWFTPQGPDSWYAIYRALMHLQEQGIVDFPPPVKVWLRYYGRSFKRPGDPQLPPVV